MTESIVSSVYSNQIEGLGLKFWDIFEDTQLNFFAFGRHALAQWFSNCNFEKGTRVLLPSFICGDILSSLHAHGLVPEYYEVDRSLQPVLPGSPHARALIFVNYFGFPQKIEELRSYANRHKLQLLEDNTLSLFSRDTTGAWLGKRGCDAILSFRKILHVPSGAALVGTKPIATKRPYQITSKEGLRFQSKVLLKSSVSFLGTWHIRRMLEVGRWLESGFLGEGEETELPTDGPIPGVLLRKLSHVSIHAEVERRRKLYQFCEEFGFESVFKSLPEGVCPYGYAFFADPQEFRRIEKEFNKQGLDVITWPKLPKAVQDRAPEFYKQVRVVRFLW